MSSSDHALRGLLQCTEQFLCHHRIGDPLISLPDRIGLIGKGAIQARVEADDRQRSVRREILFRNRPSQGLTRDFRENIRVFCARRMVGEGFQDRSQVANGHAFSQEMRQHAYQRPERNQVRNHFLDQLRVILA